jgi:hypothetical protein
MKKQKWYNRSQIMKQAHRLYNNSIKAAIKLKNTRNINIDTLTWGEAISKAWKQARSLYKQVENPVGIFSLESLGI